MEKKQHPQACVIHILPSPHPPLTQTQQSTAYFRLVICKTKFEQLLLQAAALAKADLLMTLVSHDRTRGRTDVPQDPPLHYRTREKQVYLELVHMVSELAENDKIMI